MVIREDKCSAYKSTLHQQRVCTLCLLPEQPTSACVVTFEFAQRQLSFSMDTGKQKALDLDTSASALGLEIDEEHEQRNHSKVTYEAKCGGTWRTVHVGVEVLVLAGAVLAILMAYDARSRVGELELELRALQHKVL